MAGEPGCRRQALVSWVLFEGALVASVTRWPLRGRENRFDVCTFIARNRAVSYVDRYDDKSPKEALGMFRSRIRRVWGHAAIFAWSDLILDRSRKLVGLQSPAACATRAGGDSDPNFENYDLFHAQSPDTGRGVHARSWRANRDVDVRR